MRLVLKKLLLIIISLLALGWVLYFVEPPSSWQKASVWQILIFFLPLLVFFTFVANLFLNYLPQSFIVGLGIIMLLVLKAVGQLNIITTALLLIFVVILIVFFRKPKRNSTLRSNRGLTRGTRIPKLTRIQ